MSTAVASGSEPSASLRLANMGCSSSSVAHKLDLPRSGWLAHLAFFVCTILPWALVFALSWLLAHPSRLLTAQPEYLPYSAARLSPAAVLNSSILSCNPPSPNEALFAPAVTACPPAPQCPACPPTSPSSPPAASPADCPSRFVHGYKDGVWSKAQYVSWLAQKPGDNPRRSAAYPYNSDYSWDVEAVNEAGGRLSIAQVQVVVLTGVKNHRERGDAIMASWGHMIPSGHLYMYSDAADDEQRLPVIHFPHTPGRPNASERIAGIDPPQYTHPFGQYYSLEDGDRLGSYARAMIRWLQGMQHAFPLVVANPSIRWLMFADDDTFVYWPHILRLCAEYDSSIKHSLANVLHAPHIAGGAGWLISRAVVEAMIDRVVECYEYYWRECADLSCIVYDLQISRCFMDKLNTVPEQRLELEERRLVEYTFPSSPPDTRHPPDLIFKRRNGKLRGATFHYTKGEDMVALHNIAMAIGGR